MGRVVYTLFLSSIVLVHVYLGELGSMYFYLGTVIFIRTSIGTHIVWQGRSLFPIILACTLSLSE